MKLRDRYRRWRKPAQWYDDHPDQRKQREQAGRANVVDNLAEMGPSGRMNIESDFKKPRY
jgi:hypothetical protein